MITDNIELLIAVIIPYLVSSLLLIVGAISLICLPKLFKEYLKSPILFKIIFPFLLITAAIIRFEMVPNTHRINFDEDRYLSYAVTFARFGVETNINLATPQKLLSGVPDSAARITVPTINGWLLRFFGYSEQVLFNGAKVSSILQIFLITILAYMLTRNYFISLFAAGGTSLLPPVVFWSVSTSLDLYFVGFTLLTLIGCLWFARQVNIKSTIFLLSSFLLLLFVRVEGILILPVLLLFIVYQRKENKLAIISKKDLSFVILCCLLILFRIFVSISIVGKPWCCGEGTPLETFMLGYLIRDIIPNVQSLFFKAEVPFLLTLLAIFSLVKNNFWYTKILGLWLIIFFLLYSSYYAGKFFAVDFSGSYGRFFLMLVPPLLILAGTGLVEIVKQFEKNKERKKYLYFAFIVLVLVTFFPTVKNYKFMVSTSPYENIVEKNTRIFHKHLEEVLIKKTEPNATLIHTLTGLTLLYGKESVYIGSFVEDSKTVDFVIDRLKKGKSVYMIATDICLGNETLCKKTLKNVRQRVVFPETSQKYNLTVMKLELKPPQEP